MAVLPQTADASITARLNGLAPLRAEDADALAQGERMLQNFPPNREIFAEGQRIDGARIFQSGWACRSRMFADGRRQILGLLLPGDLIGMCRHSSPLAITSVFALTRVTLFPAPTARPGSGLEEAYARSGALEEYYLFRQIARLGRLNAYERMIDLLLEIRERLTAVNLVTNDSFALPVTQDVMADLLGLTGVHVNRMLQRLRSEGLLDLRGSVARLSNVDRLLDLVEYRAGSTAWE